MHLCGYLVAQRIELSLPSCLFLLFFLLPFPLNCLCCISMIRRSRTYIDKGCFSVALLSLFSLLHVSLGTMSPLSVCDFFFFSFSPSVSPSYPEGVVSESMNTYAPLFLLALAHGGHGVSFDHFLVFLCQIRCICFLILFPPGRNIVYST